MLTNLAYLKSLIESSGFYFKKNYGQNFLTDQNTAERIALTALSPPCSLIFEVGPGAGALTEILVSYTPTVCVEIDPFAVKMLSTALGDNPNLTIVHADYLKYDLESFFKTYPDIPINFVSNLPYSVASPIIMKTLTKGHFQSITLMLQTELAERLTALPGSKNYSHASAFVTYYANVKRDFDVSSNCFYPKPKVDSTVITLTPRPKKPVTPIDEPTFLRTIRAGFAMRRKTFVNNLSHEFHLPKETLSQTLESLSLDPMIRGEKLSIYEFSAISDEITRLI
jgi:16S rRNA (adenine1518-N6/adenine1519-N6)-dimethyltransferase